MKRKILFISPQPFFQWRGSPIRVKFNLLALTQLGYAVDLLTLPIGENHPIRGVRVFRVANPLKVENIPIGPSLNKCFYDVLIFFYGLYLCKKNNYDVIHGVEEAGCMAVIFAKIFKCKAIFEKHSDPSSYKQKLVKNMILNSYAMVERLVVQMSRAVICTGPGLTAQVNAMNPQTQVFTVFDIPSSLEESSEKQCQEVRRKLVKKSDEILITYIGSFAVYQGIDLLFAVIPQVVQKAKHARFIIIGGSDHEIEANSKSLRERGVAGNVTFLGKVAPDLVPHYLAASDILLSPRASGVNTPLKILDYLKAGKAIVATDHPANRHLLNDNSAVLAKPEKQAFADAILSLLDDAHRRLNLGCKCRKMYERTYTFEHHCQRLAQCYATVLNS